MSNDKNIKRNAFMNLFKKVVSPLQYIVKKKGGNIEYRAC